MTILIVVALALICATVTQCELCRFLHQNKSVTRGNLTCKHKIYPKPVEMIAAFNECADDKSGTELDFNYVMCLYDKNGFINNGVIDSVAISATFRRDSIQHHRPLFNGIWECQLANPTQTNFRNPLKLIACMARAYQNACVYKTCNFTNTPEQKLRIKKE